MAKFINKHEKDKARKIKNDDFSGYQETFFPPSFINSIIVVVHFSLS